MNRNTQIIGLYLFFFEAFYPNASFGGLDIFLNDDQKGYSNYSNKEYDKAKQNFQNSHWKGVAAIKSGDYETAIDNLSKVEDESVHAKYNLGNAHALSGDLERAADKYKEVLDIDSNFADAKHNLKVVEEMKKQSSNKSGDGKEKQSNKKNQDNENKKQKDNKENNKNQQQNQQENKDKQKGNNQNQSKKDEKQKKNDKQDKSDSGKDNKDQKKDEQKPDKKNKPSDRKKNQQQKEPQKSIDQTLQKQYNEKDQATEQWLRSIPHDPGGLLKQKFLRDHLYRKGR